MTLGEWQVHPGLVASQSQNTETTTATHTYKQFSVVNKPSLQDFGLWEKTEVKPTKVQREYADSTRKALSQNSSQESLDCEADVLTICYQLQIKSCKL